MCFAGSVEVGSMNITYDQFVLNSTGDAVSQTCIGTYGEPVNGVSKFSRWVQDLENRRIRWDIGNPSDNGSVTYYYLDNIGYTVSNINGVLTCSSTNQMTFAQAQSNMFYPTTRYIAVGSYNGVPHRIYTGMNPMTPGGSSTGMVKFISVADKKFSLMAVLTSAGYNYYDYPNVLLGAPKVELFTLPSVCTPTDTGNAGTLKANGLLAFSLLAASTLALRWTV